MNSDPKWRCDYIWDVVYKAHHVPFSSRFVLGLPKLRCPARCRWYPAVCSIQVFFSLWQVVASWRLMKSSLIYANEISDGFSSPQAKSGCLTERIWAEPSTVGEAKEMLSWNRNKKVGFLLGVLFLAGRGSINDLQLKNYTRIPKKGSTCCRLASRSKMIHIWTTGALNDLKCDCETTAHFCWFSLWFPWTHLWHEVWHDDDSQIDYVNYKYIFCIQYTRIHNGHTDLILINEYMA